ncbi:uncharacterized protein LOC110008319 isoform X3 [Amborella trichopoda]|uniref:uncharacterized protein LOC110008319 isoform X3 n=1 Tax=Amborella trichopoda TaxID=13333 RepID=UPI0009BD371A|nr:uncharacterized protein LOC110008319 isoform X3 [Amborella trichopoda]|eukprot:XP_020530657.1 uncharacterized protein LOC110008319 isoform X3 [Amborella trichopoda]
MSSSPTFSLLVCLPLWHCGEVTANHAELESLLQGLLIYMERGIEIEDEYIISEKELLVNSFISIPYDMGTFNCGAFVAGIVRGFLDVECSSYCICLPCANGGTTKTQDNYIDKICRRGIWNKKKRLHPMETDGEKDAMRVINVPW